MAKIANFKELKPTMDTLNSISAGYKSAVENIKKRIEQAIQEQGKTAQIDLLKKQLQEYQEMESNIEKITLRTITDNQLKAIYQGAITKSNYTEIFFVIKTSDDNLMIVLNEQGLQEIAENLLTEEYKATIDPYLTNQSLTIKTNKINQKVEKVWYSRNIQGNEYFDKLDILISTGRINKLKEFEKTKNYSNDFIVKEQLLSTQDASNKLNCSFLYKNRSAKLPTAIIKNLRLTKNGKALEKILYQLDKKTGKYSNVADLDSPQVTFEEFEKSLEEEYGLTPITNSISDQYFNGDKKLEISEEVQQILAEIKELEKGKNKQPDEVK